MVRSRRCGTPLPVATPRYNKSLVSRSWIYLNWWPSFKFKFFCKCYVLEQESLIPAEFNVVSKRGWYFDIIRKEFNEARFKFAMPDYMWILFMEKNEIILCLCPLLLCVKKRVRTGSLETLLTHLEAEEKGEGNEGKERKGFFACCYLLFSLSPRHRPHQNWFYGESLESYKQQNGKKTNCMGGPRNRQLEIVLCSYGFSANVSAF